MIEAATKYSALVEMIYDKYGFNVAHRTLIQMNNELGYTADIKEQVNWLSRFLKSSSDISETSSIGRSYVYASGKSSGIYGITESGSVTTSVIDSTATKYVTTNSAFGTEIITYEGEQAVSLSTVGGTTGSGSVGSFIVGEVIPAAAAVACGIALGVEVDSILYNSNPDYWNEKLPTLNPETWDDIILGHDTKIPFLHNTRTGTTYINEDMLAYTSLLGQNEGWYGSPTDYDIKSDDNFNGYNVPVFSSITASIQKRNLNGDLIKTLNNISVTISSGNGKFCPYTSLNTLGVSYPSTDLEYHTYIKWNFDGEELTYIIDEYGGKYTYTYDGKTAGSVGLNNIRPYKSQVLDDYIYNIFWTEAPTSSGESSNIRAWVSVYGNHTEHHGTSITGFTKIGTTPDLSGITTLSGAKSKLRETYPNLYNNVLDVPYVNNDGIQDNTTWLPVSVPNNYIDNEGNIINKPNNKPISDNLNQTDDGSYPDEKTKNEANENSITDGSTVPAPNDPENPINTTEPTPTPVLPETPVDTGLGAVYVPTISELRSFSEWLWSPNFIEQIKKLFSDPMQGIIGLHQVYFTPAHSGTDTIHCGYLDSNVSSDYTTTRYYTIDCGTVNIRETFGNVFDYDPLTTIDLYLPFIGIVPLKVGDVMRSQLNVIYYCDVLTGACLCNVNVIRDGSKCTLYTYGGNCAVNYPLSSGSYMGIVSALVGVGLSVGTAVATGGASIPLSIGGGAASMLNAHTNVQTSGGYSGNTGAMGIKKPYVIIKNTLSAMPNQYNKYTGNPYSNVNKLINCTGFTQCNVVHLNGDMTQDEKNEIINLLSSGIII